MDFSMIGQYSRFTHVDAGKVQGNRFVLYPQLSLPIVNPAFQITPKVGLHMSQYSLENQAIGQPDSVSRVLPTFSLDSTMTFEREGDWFGKGYIQTLEPRLYYVNIPYKDQSRIPLFDTGLADFNFAQIFAENRYSGLDRVNDANQLTAALTTRLLDGDTGVERFKAMIGQRYYFKKQQVLIAGEAVRQDDFSNMVAAVNGLVAPKTYMDLAWEYNYRDNVSERFSAGVRFQPELGKVLSASYRYTRNPLTTLATVDQIDIAGQWPLSSKWYAVGRYNFSLRDQQTLESIAGVEYNAGCWAVRLVGQRLAAITGKPNDTLFFQLEFNDFGSIGTNPIGLLRRSIPGYGKINELPNSSLLTTQ
jgi:LPS-assembly protein